MGSVMEIAHLHISATSDAGKVKPELDALTASAERAEKASDNLGKASGKTSRSLESVRGAAVRAQQSQNGVAGAAARAAQEMAKAGRNYADTAGTAARMAQEMGNVRNGMQGMSDVTGAAARAQKEAAEAAAITAAAMRGTGDAADYAGLQVEGAAVRTQRLTGDMNNLGLALATGRDPADALSEAARKAAKSFNEMGAGAGAAREIGSAFMATLSPINLASIGLISFGTAAVGWLFKASEAAGTLDQQIDKLSGAVSRYTSASQAAKTSSRDLTKEYGSAAAEAKKALDNLASIDRYKAMEEVGKSIDKILTDTTISLKNVSPYLKGYTDDANQLAFSFKLTGDAASSVAGSINRLEASKGVRDQVMAASRLSDELMAAYGSLEKMPKTAREVYVAAQSIVVEGGKIVGQTDSWASSLSSVLSYTNSIAQSLSNIGGGAINRAADAAEIRALEAGKSLRDAALEGSRVRARLESKDIVQGLGIQNEYLKIAVGYAAETIALGRVAQQERKAALEDEARERERAFNASVRGGGGTSGRSGQRGRRDIDGLARELASERQMLDIWYAEQAERLAMATEQELEFLGGRNEARLTLESKPIRIK